MKLLSVLRSRYAIFVHDLVMIPVAWFAAYWLRFNLETIPSLFLQHALAVLPIVVFLQGASFWYFGLYRGVWRFASIPDLVRISKAVALGVVLSTLAIAFVTHLQNIPRSVFVLDGLLLLMLLSGPRFLYRGFKDRHLYRVDSRNVLIIGAGQAGEMLARDLIRNPQNAYRPVAFVDDDKAKSGKDVHGIPVIGATDKIADVVRSHDIELILIAVTTASATQMRRIIDACEVSGVPFRTLPRLDDLIGGQVTIKQLRDVHIEDLLGRQSVSLDWDAINREIHGKRVLVTGGGGSIGSELCRQIARLQPAQLIVFEQSEFNLYTIEAELARSFPQLSLAALLGDVTDAVAVQDLFARHQPEVVFHAAAYKHVPMLEHQSRAAVINNVLGTRIVAAAADRHGCEAFVLVSTDKAVNPSNIMGTTKRVAEIVCQTLNRNSNTRFITVRFGNVLGSSGSVIPLFQKQIANGGPVTVTHPEITRYFMTIPEAAQLILQASVLGGGGEIFVLDMGEPVKIAYLAEQLIRLSGKRPGEDIQIIFTGLRPGEKLYEELFHPSEKLKATQHPKILLAASRDYHAATLDEALQILERAAGALDEAQLRDTLLRLVPEYSGQARRDTAGEGANVVPFSR